MILSKVEYELFEWEEPSIEMTTLHRQLRLTGASGERTYISWTPERCSCADDPAYSIGYGTDFFSNEPEVLLDASRSRLWSPLIGQEITIGHIDPDFFCLKIASAAHHLYCTSLDMDVVVLSAEPHRWFDS